MKCVICGNGELKPGFATTTLERDGSVVVIRDVPALICDNCGETSYEADVTEKVLEMAENALATGMVVGVLNYTDAHHPILTTH